MLTIISLIMTIGCFSLLLAIILMIIALSIFIIWLKKRQKLNEFKTEISMIIILLILIPIFPILSNSIIATIILIMVVLSIYIIYIILKKQILSKNKKWFSAIVMALILIMAFLVWSGITNNYTIKIERNYINEQEKKAIEIAENEINYSTIFNISRYDDFDNIYMANFIDSGFINYYTKMVEEKRNSLEDSRISFEYKADAKTLKNTIIKYDNKKLYIKDGEETIFSEYMGKSSTFAIKNNSKYDILKYKYDDKVLKKLKDRINLEYNETIVVKMYMEFDYLWAPLGGVNPGVNQFVVFNENYVPLFICIEVRHVVS